MDVEDLSDEELIEALREAVPRSILGYHRRQHWAGKGDVWTPAGDLTEIQQCLRAWGVTDVRFSTQWSHSRKLVCVLNAIDADVQRVLEGGKREELEEVYLGLRRVKNENLR